MLDRRETLGILVAWLLAPAPLAAQIPTPPPSGAPKLSAAAPAIAQVIATSLDAQNRAGAVGATLTFKATLSFAKPPASAAGHALQFLVGGALACVGKTDGSGVGSCDWRIPELSQGSRPYEIVFAGTSATPVGGAQGRPEPLLGASKATKSLLVTKADSKISMEAIEGFASGAKARFRTDARRTTDGVLMPAGLLTFKVNGQDLTPQLEHGSSVVFDLILPDSLAGILTIEAFFAGNEFTNPTSGRLQTPVTHRGGFTTRLTFDSPPGTLTFQDTQKNSKQTAEVRLSVTLAMQMPGASWVALPGATVRFYRCFQDPGGPGDCSQMGMAITDSKGAASQTFGAGIDWRAYQGPRYAGDQGPDRAIRIEARYEGDATHAATFTSGQLLVHYYTVGKSPI